MNKLQEMNILIVGLGLIGGSYAARFASAGIIVNGIDINQETIVYAKEQGYIANNDISDIEKIKMADLIILGLYPKDINQWIIDNQKYFQSQTVISDVSGVKVKIVAEVQKNLRPDCEFIASHPMAGKEVSGIKHASSELFLKANFLITPTPANTEGAVNLLKEVGEILGFKYIEVLSVTEHDEIIAFLSQLPHAMAISLMHSHETENYIKYTGDSFRDLTRIAKINEALWSELFLLNKDNLIKEIDGFINVMEKLKKDLICDDFKHLQTLMKQSTHKRKLFDKTK